MCYNIAYLTKKKLDYARRFRETGDMTDLEKVLNELYGKAGPTYYASGFDHPDVPVITNTDPGKIQLFGWGLIPYWVKDPMQAVEISKRTINARGENIFEKPSFRVPAKKQRCLVLVDGFFEFHWKNDKAYPFYISLKSNEPMALAGLWDTWHNSSENITRNTFTIVTTRANSIMTFIHNKPKASEGSRMPVIIPRESEKVWLNGGAVTDKDINIIRRLLVSYDSDALETYTVGKLKGKNAAGNTPRALEKFDYPEMT